MIPFRSEDLIFGAEPHDLRAFHGGRYPAGVAIGYKALILATTLLFPGGGSFVRGKATVATPFPGVGFRDAMEMTLRTTSLGRYHFDLNTPSPAGALPAPVEGKFFFRFSQEGGHAALSVREGLVPQEFYELSQLLHQGALPPNGEQKVLELRREVARAILKLSPEDIFIVHSHEASSPVGIGDQTIPILHDLTALSLEDYESYTVSLDQMLLNHGYGSVCGLCLVWALARQIAQIAGGDALKRREWEFRVGAEGEGVRDGLEFLFRAFSDGRAVFDKEWGLKQGAPLATRDGGAFAFEVRTSGFARTFVLKQEFAPTEYLRLCDRKNRRPSDFTEETARKQRQVEFARRMLKEKQAFDLL